MVEAAMRNRLADIFGIIGIIAMALSVIFAAVLFGADLTDNVYLVSVSKQSLMVSVISILVFGFLCALLQEKE